MNPKQTTIVLLRIFNFSSIQAVKGSKSEIEELKAAIEIYKFLNEDTKNLLKNNNSITNITLPIYLNNPNIVF
mgnify:CR=1 FL=1